MKDKKQNITETKINPTNTFVGVDALVGLPPLQLNEIYNDDSFKLIERVPAKTVDLILEDMPYNTTACEWDVKIDLELYWKTRLRILKPTGVVILTASQPFTTDLIVSNRKMFKYEWIFHKNRGANFMQLKTQPSKEHENILIFTAGGNTYNAQRIYRTFESLKRDPIGATANRKIKSKNVQHYAAQRKDKLTLAEDGMRAPRSVLYFSIDVDRYSEFKHPTQKPVGLFEYLIRTYTNEGELVFDGFGGSGTTAIAAHKCKRNFIVIEKEKKYFDLAVRRLDIERAQYTMF